MSNEKLNEELEEVVKEKKEKLDGDTKVKDKNGDGEKLNPIVLAVVVGIIIVIAIAAGMAAFNSSNPENIPLTENGVQAAFGVLDNEEVLVKNPDVDGFVDLQAMPLAIERIDGVNYYPIEITFYLESDEVIAGIEDMVAEDGYVYTAIEQRAYGPYYVDIQNGTVFIKNSSGVLESFNYTYENFSSTVVPMQVDDGRVENFMDANQVIFKKNIMTDNPYITGDTPVETLDIDKDNSEPTVIDGVDYYPIQITTFLIPTDYESNTIFDDENRDKTFGPYYIDAESNVYLLDDSGALFEFDPAKDFEIFIQY